jgi:hypothetical protein
LLRHTHLVHSLFLPQVPITDPRRVQEAADKMQRGCDAGFMDKLSPAARQDLQAAIDLVDRYSMELLAACNCCQ